MPQTLASAVAAPPSAAGDDVLDDLEPPPGSRALVIGHRTLETLCGLIRRGCAGATELRPSESAALRPEAADITVLPDPVSLAEASAAVAIARRALVPGGRIAIIDRGSRNWRDLAALLRTSGFVEVATRDRPDGMLVVGWQPAAMGRA